MAPLNVTRPTGRIGGTTVSPTRINVIFALILTPLIFTRGDQYPWQALDWLPWFRSSPPSTH